MTSAKAGMTVSSRLPLLIISTEFSIQQYMGIKNTEECSCQVSLLYHRAGTVLLGLKTLFTLRFWVLGRLATSCA